MRVGSFSSWQLGWWLLLTPVACSNILGISSYEIDPRLDPSSTGPGGAAPLEDGGAPTTDQSAGAGDSSASGAGTVGGSASEGAAGAGAGTGGVAGEPPVASGCQSDDECDDTIDCTVDSCLAGGECEHLPSPSLCDSANCEVCTLGIGCVAGPQTQVQLLTDPRFDDSTSGWKQDGGTLIIQDARAISSPNLVQLGPVAPDATETGYGDVYQTVKIPPGTAALSLTLNFRFTRGLRTPSNDEEYVVAALYQRNATSPTVEFHQFLGTDAAQPTWKQVTYKASPAQVARLLDKDLTFDLVARSFDGEYLFDDLKLDATVCQSGTQ